MTERRDKSTLGFCCAVVVVTLLGIPASADDRPVPPIVWTATEGCAHPKSAYFEPQSGLIFVSQISGGGDARDGDGWISKLDRDGKVLAAKWVVGLNAPKGLRSLDNTLWVSDLDELVAIDIPSATIARRVRIRGASSLHDVAIDREGNVYTGDMLANRIFKYRDGTTSVFAEGPHLDYPNGLLVDRDSLIVGGRGEMTDKLQVIRPGHLYRLNLTRAEKKLVVEEPLGDLDGIEVDGAGGYVVTDWLGGKVFHVRKDGVAKMLFQLDLGTSRHAYFPDRRLLVVPRMLRNNVTAYDLSGLIETMD